MEARIRRIKTTLTSDHFKMNDSWLWDCIEYYISNRDNPPDDEVYEFVKSQWLLSDLRQINSDNGSLPRNLAQQLCTVLPSTYILQMDKIYDISKSKYKQLQEIRNVSTANVDVNEERSEQTWEPKEKRMLQMYLTDGIQDVSAIEYKPIPFLNNMLLPGYKVMIIGPVTCRRGVILLESKNFKEVGGEEASLLICNALENVLARALDMPENPDPYNDNKTTQQENRRPEHNQGGFDEEFDIDFENIPDISDPGIQSGSRSSVSSNQNRNNNPTELLSTNSTGRNNPSTKVPTHKTKVSTLETTDTQEFNIPSTSSGRSVSNRMNEKPIRNNTNHATQGSKVNPGVRENKVQAAEENNIPFPDDDFDFADFDVVPNNVEHEKKNSFGQQQMNTYNTKPQIRTTNANTITKIYQNEFPDDDFDFGDFDVATHSNKSTANSNVRTKKTVAQKSSTSNSIVDKQSNVHPMTKPCPSDHGKNKSSSLDISKLSICTVRSHSSPVGKPSNMRSVLQENKPIVIIDVEDLADDDFDFDTFEGASEKSENNQCKSAIPIDKRVNKDSTTNPLSKQRSIATCKTVPTNTTASISCISSKTPPFAHNSSLSKQSNTTCTATGNKRLATTPVRVAPQKMRRTQETPSRRLMSESTSNRKISDFLTKISPTAEPPKVCDFLCDIIKETVKDVTYKTVQAQVNELGKLAIKNSCWQLEGVITDRTACLDIIFASEVLERELGYNVQEFSEKKKLKKTKPEVLRNAEFKLRNLDALVDLELKPNERARVICINNSLTAKKK